LGNILGYKVEAMILHAGSMVAFFVDQLAQAPVQIQCVQQAAPESWVKWLLQFALGIVPVAGGVWIAWMAFRWNTKKEHLRWVLDQKKAEWREILDTVNADKPHITSLSKSQSEEPIEIQFDAAQWVHNVNEIFMDRLFIDEKIIRPIRSHWQNIQARAQAGQEGDIVARKESTFEFLILIEEIREAAKKDLNAQDRTRSDIKNP
jgi:hypothetical protein